MSALVDRKRRRMEFSIAQTIDTKGMNCPLPVLRAKKAISALDVGDVIEIIATDPGAAKDFEAFSRITGHDLIESTEDGGVFRFLIKKKV